MESYSVEYIKENSNTFENRFEIKKKGPPRPELQLAQECTLKNKKFKRVFKVEQYKKTSWLCGCDKLNALFCFPCLIFAGSPKVSVEWTKTGVTDLSHLSAKIKKHASSEIHMKNEINLSDIGNIDIRQFLDSAYQKSIKNFNEQVSKNRYVLSRLIDCIKFCGAFELALRGHDETSGSLNRGIYRGLIDFVAEIDVAMKQHLEGSNVFKGTSKSVQNDLLDAMLIVYQEEIKKQILETRFVAIQADETTDVSTHQQFVLILRYERNGHIHERFWKYLNPASYSAKDIAIEIKKELTELNILPNKLVGQSYDGAAVMSGKVGGVQKPYLDIADDRGELNELGASFPPLENVPIHFATENNTVVTSQTGSTALIPCIIHNIGEGMVSWIRRKDYHLLTVGLTTYSSDDRFQAIHLQHSEDWTLQIKFVQQRDDGLYECQVSSHPPTSIFIRLNVVEAKAEIQGPSEKYLKPGSGLRLQCTVLQSTEPPSYLFWYHNNRMINYDGDRGINVTTDLSENTSTLTITSAATRHSGNYSCVPSNAQPASTYVHILNGENPAAMQHGGRGLSWLQCSPSSWLLVFTLFVMLC